MLPVSWLIVSAAGLAFFVPLQAAAPQATGGRWGDPINGVALRVTVVAPAAGVSAPTSIDLPPFELQLHNGSTGTLIFIGEALGWADIDVDGTWYSSVQAGSCCGPRERIRPGGESPLHRLEYYNELFAVGGAAPLRLTSGRHTIRVRTAPPRPEVGIWFEDAPAKQIQLVSNEITIAVPDVPVEVRRQALVAAVSSGGSAAWSAVPKLVDQFPDAVLGAIERGLAATGDDLIRGMLVSWLTDVPGEDVNTFLGTLMGDKVDLPARTAAAMILFRRHDARAVPAAVDAWRALQPTLATPGPSNALDFAVGNVVTILSESDDAAAIELLAHGLRDVPIDLRVTIMRAVLPKSAAVRTGTSGGRSFWLNGDLPAVPGGAAGTAIERLLASELDDEERRTGLEGTIGGISIVDPRAEDLAAVALSIDFPSKYTFRWSEDMAERDRQIAHLREIARASGGSPPSGGEPLPLPSERPVSFTNVTVSHSDDPHASGLAIELYKHAGAWTGFISEFVGPVADPPVGKLDGLQLDEHAGKIVFTARLSVGLTQARGAKDWVPTKDVYVFTGSIDQDAISGALVHRLVDDPAGGSTSEKIVLKREATKTSAEGTSYDDWFRNWDLRMKARGPKGTTGPPSPTATTIEYVAASDCYRPAARRTSSR